MNQKAYSTKIPPWVSCHTYQPHAGECRTIIHNQLTHEVLTLEGVSSKIWKLISSGMLPTELQCEKIGVSQEELIGFLNELEDVYLLEPKQSNADFGDLRISQLPVVDKGAEDTSHLQIETEFSAWCESNGFMSSAFIEVTYRCNERCVHCFNPGAAHTSDEKPNRNVTELTTEEFRQLINEMHSLGTYKITFSGGEFFIREDAFELLDLARANHMAIEIFTNGLLLDENRVNRLSKYWPHTVNISLYSANPILHDKITCVPGSWEQSIAALRRLRKHGIKTKIKCALTHDTVQGYKLVKKLASDLGAFISFDTFISAGNDGAMSPVDLNVKSFEEIIFLATQDDSPWYVGSLETKFLNKVIDHDGPICGVGCSTLSITPEGDIFPCVALPNKIGCVKKDGGLTSIWTNSEVGKKLTNSSSCNVSSLTEWQILTYSKTIECGTHERCQWCNRCVGASVAETSNTSLAPTEMQCFQAAARLEASKMLRRGMTSFEIAESLGISGSFGEVYLAR